MAGDRARVTFEGVRIIFRNFSGAPTKFNAKGGKRTFNIVLDHDTAEKMSADGWNVRYLRPREEEEEPQPVLKVNVNFDGRPPTVVLITSRGKTRLSPDTVPVLDYAEVTNVDCIINQYHYVGNDGQPGISAYLQSIYVTIQEDELELKYASVPEDSGAMGAIHMRAEVLAIDRGTGDEEGEPPPF